MALLILLVGLPGAGKTTVARRLASEHSGLRLTPDEWMIPLFGDSDANGKRDVLEGRMITVALQLLRLETNVVLDFGCWSRDERSCLRWLTQNEGASFRLIYLPVERNRQLERIKDRWASAPDATFPVTAADLDRWRAMFEVPEPEEFEGLVAAAPPPPWTTWPEWAQDRWPSFSID